MELRPFGDLGRHVASRQDAWLEGEPPDEAIRANVTEAAARAPAPGRWLPIALALSCALAAVLVAWRIDRAALTFSAGNPPRESVAGDWLSAPAGTPLLVSFSDGSRITLQPGARGRVATVRRSGADWVLESGDALFDVSPRPGNEWRVLMGPFKVDVVGTRFTVSWNPEKEELSLGLEHGAVIVVGCGLGVGQHVEAGQRLRASCPSRTFSVSPLAEPEPQADERRTAITPLEALPSAKTEPSTITQLEALPTEKIDPGAPSGATERAREAAGGAVAPASRGGPRPPENQTWQELARRGHFDRAFARVEKDFEVTCDRASLDDVLLLADAARLSAHVSPARNAYRAARRRFPGTSEGARAAFHLGQLDAQSGNLDGAARWFDAYLAEQPESRLAEAAIGRLIELRTQQGNARLAQEAASTYLARYPNGAHAERARSVLHAPRPAR